VLGLAGAHGLTPLLYRHLAGESIPKPVFAQLWSLHETTARRNQAMSSELCRILRRLADHGIAAVPYKGPVLAQVIYGDVALRVFGDLDILVRPGDLLPARELLLADGYERQYALAPAQEAALVRSFAQQHLSVVHRAKDILVELHWRLSAAFRLCPPTDEAWWAARVPVDFGGLRVPGFTVEELVLLICLHNATHLWCPGAMGGLVDVAELIRQHPRLDWEGLISVAAATGAGRKLALGLHLAHAVLAVPLPDDVLRWIAGDPEVPVLAHGIVTRWFGVNVPRPRGLGALYLSLRMSQRWRDRVQYVAAVLLVPGIEEWTLCPLPAWLSFLYYPLRALRLLVRSIRRTLSGG
jgi:hypothetical protein